MPVGVGAGEVEQVEQVLLRVPRVQDRAADLLWQCVKVEHHRIEVLAVHPGRAAGQAVAQFPFPVALASASSALLERGASAHLGQGLVGQLDDVEVVDHQHGARQRFAHGGLEHGAHVDCDELDLVLPCLAAGVEPGGHASALTT